MKYIFFSAMSKTINFVRYMKERKDITCIPNVFFQLQLQLAELIVRYQNSRLDIYIIDRSKIVTRKCSVNFKTNSALINCIPRGRVCP